MISAHSWHFVCPNLQKREKGPQPTLVDHGVFVYPLNHGSMTLHHRLEAQESPI
jgi:hypothetical protein